MKKRTLFCLILGCVFFCNTATAQNDVVKNNFDFASKQLIFALDEMKHAIENESDKSIHERSQNNWSELTNPRSLEPDGELIMVPSKDWCSGFFPGELWYIPKTKSGKI